MDRREGKQVGEEKTLDSNDDLVKSDERYKPVGLTCSQTNEMAKEQTASFH